MRWSMARWFLWSALLVACFGTAWLVDSRVATSAPTVDLRAILQLEIADTVHARERGLSGRPALPKGHGMLFVFDKSGIYPFWMREMKFPLDIVWINHGIVQELVRLDPPAHATLAPEWHIPTHAADRVLELNVGVAQRLGLARGVKVLLAE